MPKPVNVKILHVRLRVAEKMLNQAMAGETGRVKTVAPAPAPAENGAEVDPRQALIASAIEATDAPIAVVEAGGDDPTFRIIYTNLAMAETTQFDEEELVGKSLAELEAWTPEFLDMACGFVGRGAVLSHVPLWSTTKQQGEVYLSFCPIRDGDAPISHYLVVHHL
jgi:PAS domain-containing protein